MTTSGDEAESAEGRFTRTGGKPLDALIEAQLSAIVRDLLASLPKSELDVLALGGGYGRGEGGALFLNGEWAPYNDYDLVLVHRVRDASALEKTLQRIHVEHSKRCGIHVDITPIRRDHLCKLPLALTWYEFQKGHRTLFGDESILLSMGERRLEDIPASEWGRLLFNRGSGVLFAIWLLQGKKCNIAEGETFEAFATRQVKKAWLSLGDVWLADRGLYRPSVQERRGAWLKAGSALPEWSEHYLAATDFKLTPTAPMLKADLIDQLATLAHHFGRDLSRRRASATRPLVGLYSTWKGVDRSRWLLSLPWRYPRERLRIALAAELLGDSSARYRLVGSPAHYIQLWERYA